ncbi:MAG: DnaJ domain-containing protein [Cyclobacteriaceae bacterium]|nr:DnaJ domain-containing protein [Cyclobacteriaceae bacterium]
MQDYYLVLGVPRTAQPAEIKRAYRKLVQQLHPDVNPDQHAQELIKLVNEAYDVLGDERKRSEYDYRLENPFTQTVEPPLHRDPRYRGRGAYRPPQPKGPTERDLMILALPYFRPVAVAGCLLFALLVADYFLPPNQSVETLVKFRNEAFRRGWQDYLVTNTGRAVKIAVDDVQTLPVKSQLVFTESAIFNILVRVQTLDKTIVITNLGSLYGNFIFVPVLMAGGCVLWILGLGSLEFKFSLGIINVFLVIFTVILIFVS